jgi:hypothetical protein
MPFETIQRPGGIPGATKSVLLSGGTGQLFRGTLGPALPGCQQAD